MGEPTRGTKTGTRDLVNLRISPEDKGVIDRAARNAGKTRTEFMLDASRRAAHEALLDAALILVDGRTYDEFRAAFDAPPAPPAGLRRLMSLKAPWES